MNNNETSLIVTHRGRNAGERIVRPQPELAQELKSAEAVIRAASAVVEKGLTTIALELDRIRMEKLYLAIVSDGGLPVYPTFNCYLRLRAKELGFKRTKAMNLLKGVRALRGPSLGFTDAEVSSMPTEVPRLLPSIIVTDRKTGEILGFREGVELPESLGDGEPVGLLRRWITETVILDEEGNFLYDPSDRVKRMSHDLTLSANFNFILGMYDGAGPYVICEIVTADGEMHVFGPNDEWSDEALDELRSRLRAQWRSI